MRVVRSDILYGANTWALTKKVQIEKELQVKMRQRRLQGFDYVRRQAEGGVSKSLVSERVQRQQK